MDSTDDSDSSNSTGSNEDSSFTTMEEYIDQLLNEFTNELLVFVDDRIEELFERPWNEAHSMATTSSQVENAIQPRGIPNDGRRTLLGKMPDMSAIVNIAQKTETNMIRGLMYKLIEEYGHGLLLFIQDRECPRSREVLWLLESLESTSHESTSYSLQVLEVRHISGEYPEFNESLKNITGCEPPVLFYKKRFMGGLNEIINAHRFGRIQLLFNPPSFRYYHLVVVGSFPGVKYMISELEGKTRNRKIAMVEFQPAYSQRTRLLDYQEQLPRRVLWQAINETINNRNANQLTYTDSSPNDMTMLWAKAVCTIKNMIQSRNFHEKLRSQGIDIYTGSIEFTGFDTLHVTSCQEDIHHICNVVDEDNDEQGLESDEEIEKEDGHENGNDEEDRYDEVDEDEEEHQDRIEEEYVEEVGYEHDVYDAGVDEEDEHEEEDVDGDDEGDDDEEDGDRDGEEDGDHNEQQNLDEALQDIVLVHFEAGDSLRPQVNLPEQRRVDAGGDGHQLLNGLEDIEDGDEDEQEEVDGVNEGDEDEEEEGVAYENESSDENEEDADVDEEDDHEEENVVDDDEGHDDEEEGGVEDGNDNEHEVLDLDIQDVVLDHLGAGDFRRPPQILERIIIDGRGDGPQFRHVLEDIPDADEQEDVDGGNEGDEDEENDGDNDIDEDEQEDGDDEVGEDEEDDRDNEVNENEQEDGDDEVDEDEEDDGDNDIDEDEQEEGDDEVDEDQEDDGDNEVDEDEQEDGDDEVDEDEQEDGDDEVDEDEEDDGDNDIDEDEQEDGDDEVDEDEQEDGDDEVDEDEEDDGDNDIDEDEQEDVDEEADEHEEHGDRDETENKDEDRDEGGHQEINRDENGEDSDENGNEEGKTYNQGSIVGMNFIICGGSIPHEPQLKYNIPGIENCVTIEEYLFESDYPKNTLIIGNTPDAFEFAYLLSMCGGAVTIMTTDSKWLPDYDEEAIENIMQSFNEHRVRFLRVIRILQIIKLQSGYDVMVELENIQYVNETYAAVVSEFTREPISSLINAENAGIDLDVTSRKIMVNRNFTSSNPAIWAFGRAAQGHMESQEFEMRAGKRVINLVLNGFDSIPHIIYPQILVTPLEYGFAGETEESAKTEYKEDMVIYKYKCRPISSTETTEPVLSIKMICTDFKNERIIGIYLLGKNAASHIMIFATSLEKGLTKRDFLVEWVQGRRELELTHAIGLESMKKCYYKREADTLPVAIVLCVLPFFLSCTHSFRFSLILAMLPFIMTSLPYIDDISSDETNYSTISSCDSSWEREVQSESTMESETDTLTKDGWSTSEQLEYESSDEASDEDSCWNISESITPLSMHSSLESEEESEKDDRDVMNECKWVEFDVTSITSEIKRLVLSFLLFVFMMIFKLFKPRELIVEESSDTTIDEWSSNDEKCNDSSSNDSTSKSTNKNTDCNIALINPSTEDPTEHKGNETYSNSSNDHSTIKNTNNNISLTGGPCHELVSENKFFASGREDSSHSSEERPDGTITETEYSESEIQPDQPPTNNY